jgi:hypothetical protein
MMMGRPSLDYRPVRVVISASPKLARYLDMLVRKEAYGTSRPEVARTACWRLVEELQKSQILDQIKDDV